MQSGSGPGSNAMAGATNPTQPTTIKSACLPVRLSLLIEPLLCCWRVAALARLRVHPTCRLSLVACCLSLVACRLSLVACCLSLVACPLSLLSLVTCHLSLVAAVACPLSLVACFHLAR